MMMMMMMKTYDRDVDVSHDQQNQHNQPVTLRSPQHLWRHWRCQTDLRFTLRFQTFLHTFLTFLFASVKKRKIPAVFCLEVEGLFHMYYIIYIICHPFFFEIWNASKKNVRISFFAPCYFHHSSLFQLILLNSSGVFWWSHGTRRWKSSKFRLSKWKPP